VFRPTDDDCADCGNKAFAVTDALSADGSPLPACFACYVDRLDRVRVSGVVDVRTEDGTGSFVVGGSSVEETDELAGSVAGELGSGGVRVSVTDVSPLTEARDLIGDYHARELARAERSESRHVYAGTGRRGTVIDTETRTDGRIRGAVSEALARHVVEANRIRKRADVDDRVTEEFPTLAEHRATRRLRIEERVWDMAKERGVSEASERAADSREEGRGFEDYFRDWCDDRNINVRRGKPAIVRLYPGVADEIARKTDGLAGVPDFLVRGDGQRSFGGEWRPDADVFVEVKRASSNLSRDQQRVVAHLKSHGFGVYVLRGEPDDIVFDRR
jgi:hypothetical protein